jgi:hypothetical protein
MGERDGPFQSPAPARAHSMSRVNVAIAVADDLRDSIFEVAATCRALGLTHTSTLADFGLFTGSVELEDLPSLRAVPGVVAVEVERSLQITDPWESEA